MAGKRMALYHSTTMASSCQQTKKSVFVTLETKILLTSFADCSFSGLLHFVEAVAVSYCSGNRGFVSLFLAKVEDFLRFAFNFQGKKKY